jgi:hypothetical protein
LYIDILVQEQREQVKASSQRLKRVFAFLEKTLLRERAKKMKEIAIHTDIKPKVVS